MKEYPELTNSRICFRELKEKENELLLSLGAPHVDSFNSILSEGLSLAVKHFIPKEFELPSGDRVKISLDGITISNPTVPMSTIMCRTKKVYPSECRQRSETYKGKCIATIGWSLNGVQKTPVDKDMGDVPIMLKSDACNLKDLSPSELVKRGEHENTWGGYFIVRGNEKVVRMLLMTRRNYPVAIKRSSWKDRGHLFTELGVMIRSVREDHTSFLNILHYLTNGTAKFMFAQNKFMSYVPVCLVLKMLLPVTDAEIFKKLTQGYEKDQYYINCVKNMLREVHDEGLHTQKSCKEYLGSIFRQRFYELPPWYTNEEITDFILRQRVLIHLDNFEDKFNLIIFMVQKLFQHAQDKNKIETVDSVMSQEVLLAGHLYQKYLIERIDSWMFYLQKLILKRNSSPSAVFNTTEFTYCINHTGGIDKIMQTFLATGNISTGSGLGLMQTSGLVIMAENINRMRYMSHFRAVHRGSFFTTMRTTEARQLSPEAWGFICPVHTPDGTPCGLLNHLTTNCKISNVPDQKKVAIIPNILIELGMIPYEATTMEFNGKFYTVMLEGKVLGYIRLQDAQRIVHKLRQMKIAGTIPEMTEIALVPFKQNGQYPGLFLFVGPTRMMRPVLNLNTNSIEYIGTFEQVYMDICIDKSEAYPEVTTHMELSKIDFLSNLANLIPMPDYNQSPRNMYQCQMGKQTMGTPCHNYQLQADNKLYRLQTPATPLFRPVHHDNLELDDFAMGTNAIVAVISYTGYDMEDAMIINKAAFERGFAHGGIYKSKFIELKGTSYFARDPHKPELTKFLDNDGLPHPGSRISHKSILYCYFDTDESVFKTSTYDDKEEAVIDNVKYCGNFKLNAPKMACITYRVPRNPSVGDKFASRAGQKGICSFKFPDEDLPFTESGMIPDIVFNPHGFPSRMTIAMMIETMAGKSAAIHGLVHDATPFRFTEKNTAINYFGELLMAGGYNYYGTETMYSGVDGREMVANIFFGVVHYQRLRHMVSDKWQVRSTGPIDALTHQPIKGRTRGGGVRFGEMERDALISHGASFLLQDRLFHNSDKISTLICNTCGTLIGPMKRVFKKSSGGLTATPATCRLCKENAKIENIEIPFVFKYLTYELNSLNINCNFKFLNI